MSFRKEEKLKVHKGQLMNLLDWVFQNGGTELYKPRTVSSTYFDNDYWSMFNDSEEGSVPRKKIRVRSYSADPHTQENSSLEVKTSSIEGRYKTITQKFNLQKALNYGVFDKDYGVCHAKVRINYQRAYYKIFGVRLTIDKNIEYIAINGHSHTPHKIVENGVAVEIKAPDSVTIEYLNSQFPYERIRFSKYSKAINSLMYNTSVTF